MIAKGCSVRNRATLPPPVGIVAVTSLVRKEVRGASFRVLGFYLPCPREDSVNLDKATLDFHAFLSWNAATFLS
jgi:hypothetical protein